MFIWSGGRSQLTHLHPGLPDKAGQDQESGIELSTRMLARQPGRDGLKPAEELLRILEQPVMELKGDPSAVACTILLTCDSCRNPPRSARAKQQR
jgi:hypothetical protein